MQEFGPVIADVAEAGVPRIDKVVRMIRHWMGRSKPSIDPTMPNVPTNQDSDPNKKTERTSNTNETIDGEYRADGTTDPGLPIDGVTGTGAGPVIRY